MQVVLNVKGSFRTIGSGHNKGGDCLIQVATSTGSTVITMCTLTGVLSLSLRSTYSNQFDRF